MSSRAYSALFLLWLISGNAAFSNELVRAEPPTAGEVVAATDDRLLVLRSGIFDPLSQDLDFSAWGLAQSVISDIQIIQFSDPSGDARRRLQALGVQFLAYLPHHAYYARVPPTVDPETDPAVRWQGPVEAGMKVAPTLWPGRNLDFVPIEMQIIAFQGRSASALAAQIEKAAPQAQVFKVLDREFHPAVRVRVAMADLDETVVTLANMTDVMWLERYELPEPKNAGTYSVIQGNAGTGSPIWDRDIIGTGQIVAIADTGLDRNEEWFTQWDDGGGVNVAITDADHPIQPAVGVSHPDRKVYAYWVQPGASEYDDNNVCTTTSSSYHGTHVTGTVTGDSGTASTPSEPNYDSNDGMAPNAQVLFQDIGNDTTGCLSGLSDGYYGIFQQAVAGGARIHSNSWGGTGDSEYNSGDAETDLALWDMEELMLVFSASNDGPGIGTIGSPGNAKNVLTVGALGHGTSTSAASFSSRGPTDDGRVKPDIMAPGSSIVSARGDDDDTNVVDSPSTSSMSGTSMSAPGVAAGAILARQYFEDGYYPSGVATADDIFSPGGAMLKSILLNGTLTFSDTPSNDRGWGRMRLENNLYFSGDSRDLRLWQRLNNVGLQTGEGDSYEIDVDAGQPLRVTLVWFDPPGTPGAGTMLVNNLNLRVTAPGAAVYLGNQLVGGQSVTGGTADSIDSVEQIILSAPAAGSYTIEVLADSVPGTGDEATDRQGYGLSVSSSSCATAVSGVPGTLQVNSNNSAGIALGFTTASGASGYQVYRADGDCSSSVGDFSFVGQSGTNTFTDDLTQGGYQYAYRVRGVDACGEGDLSACVDAMSEDDCTLLPDFDQSGVQVVNSGSTLCGAELQWSAGSSNCPGGSQVRYNVYRDTDPYFVPGSGNLIAADLQALAFDDSAVTPLQTYYYVVRAEDSTHPANGNESGGSVAQKFTAHGANQPGTFSDGADAPSFASLELPWHVSSDDAQTGTYSYHNAEDGANYPKQTCAAVTTPVIDLQAGQTPVLSYAARYDLEAQWDGVVVEISTDGSTWLDLPPAGGYPGDFSQTGSPPINECGYVAARGAFNGSSSGAFVAYSSDLSAYAGQSVQIRWQFSSDPGSEENGFYLDDIQVTQASQPAQCELSEEVFADSFED